jgi:hypothetical protein
MFTILQLKLLPPIPNHTHLKLHTLIRNVHDSILRVLSILQA